MTDPYLYPGTNTLRNQLDLKDPDELRQAEARTALFASIDLRGQPLRGFCDEKRLKLIHKLLFSDIYAWAGSYRAGTGTMTKGRNLGYSVTYGDSSFVSGEVQRIFAELKQEKYLDRLGQKDFAARMAYFYSELDSTHPFREGNSRTLRQFSTDLASQAGYHLEWVASGATEESHNALYYARDQAFQFRRYGLLSDIILTGLTAL